MNDILDQASRYWNDANYISRAHYKAADLAAEWNNRLGIPVVVLTAIVGTSIFSTINSGPVDPSWKIAAGLISMAATVLSALQTFFRFSEAAEKHRSAGAYYSAVRRKLDVFLVKYRDQEQDRAAALEEFQALASRLSELAAESPRIPDKAFRIGAKEIEREQVSVRIGKRSGRDQRHSPSSPSYPAGPSD